MDTISELNHSVLIQKATLDGYFPPQLDANYSQRGKGPCPSGSIAWCSRQKISSGVKNI